MGAVLTAEDIATIADALDDLWTDDGEPVPLPPAVEAVTARIEYSELALRFSAIAEER